MEIKINTDPVRPLSNLGPSYAVTFDGGEDQILTVTEIFHVFSEVLLNETVPRYIKYTKKGDLDPEETQP